MQEDVGPRGWRTQGMEDTGGRRTEEDGGHRRMEDTEDGGHRGWRTQRMEDTGDGGHRRMEEERKSVV